MLQTANGSLTVGLAVQPGQSLLIRGGATSIGMATAVLAKNRGLTILSTTRRPDRVVVPEAIGAGHVLVNDDRIAPKVCEIIPAGVDVALKLVGSPTLPDTLRATVFHGVVCFTGMLSNHWTVRVFYPIDYLPRGVRLTAYSGGAGDLPAAGLQSFLDAVAPGRPTAPLHRTFTLGEITTVHADMEADSATGKLVILP